MSNSTFETFLVSGLLVLIAAIGFLAWAAWRWVDRERDMETLALRGVTYELRHNLKRMLSELAGIANGTLQSEINIVPVVHPQLDALLSRPNEADRKGLTLIRGNYNELSAHKASLRAALAQQADISVSANAAVEAAIGSLASLYLWEEHKGRAPEDAQSTRSWDVRDWMKANAFHADLLPGLHLRDQVVERLRQDGMTLTPKPLTYTASEYYAKLYDRKADPDAPFWKRKSKSIDEAPEEEAEPEADPIEATEPPPEEQAQYAEPEAQPNPEPIPEPASEPTAAEVIDAAEETPTETASETTTPDKPQTPGIVH